MIALLSALAALPCVHQPQTPHTYVLSNGLVQARWVEDEGRFRSLDLTDLATKRVLALPGHDFVATGDMPTMESSEMTLVGAPRFEQLHGNPGSAKLSDRLAGKRLVVEFKSSDPPVEATVSAVLQNGSRYLREEISITPVGQDLPAKRIQMIDLSAGGLAVVGSTSGSPLAGGGEFAGVEDPLCTSRVVEGRARSWRDRKLPIRAGQTSEVSSVIGFTDPGQLRRGFLAYVERERAHPYRTFLHYNSWYDLGDPYNATDCVDAIHGFRDNLVRKRGVKMSSFLFDDGWDDTKTVWEFHSGFPQGFTPVRQAAEEAGGEPGIWLSPWGGYGEPREQRLAAGKAQGYEIDSQGFALSGPKYFKRFHDVTLGLIQKYGINQFKFDGTGSPDKQYPGSAFGSDFEAAIQLIKDLREAEPNLFVNLTTGTWPSPFWTRYADSIWRGGSDHSFAGVGTNRQKWITYRDGDTYRGVVLRGPLYPLNSLMLHGIIYARYADRLDTDPGNDFKDEVRDYFGTGTQLQEMYISHALLSSQNWDDLAEAAQWSRRNSDVLVDTHWVGGDPRKLEAYGWAAWSPRKAILTLRNPSDKPLEISIDAQRVFELPKGARQSYRMGSPWKDERAHAPVELVAGTAQTISLKPFQVLTLESR